MPEKIEAIRKGLSGKELEIWFQDESRFGMITAHRRCYAPRGSRPRRAAQTKYQWLYLWGAACPASGDTVGLISPAADSDWMGEHLKLISNAAPDKHIVLILDQAGWHKSKRLRIPENITLLHLPPYSPELNPMELVWLYIKTHFMDSRLYRDYEELEDVACQSWNLMDAETIRSITGFDWIASVST